MKYFTILALFVFTISACSGKGEQATANWDFDCTENRAKIEVTRGSSNFLFSTTGLSTAATAQYYFTTCVTSITTFGSDGLFSIVSAPYFREEIAQGGGTHLQAWLQMIAIPPKNHHATISLLKQKYSTLDPNNDLKFAQQIHKLVYDFNQTPSHKRLILKKVSI